MYKNYIILVIIIVLLINMINMEIIINLYVIYYILLCINIKNIGVLNAWKLASAKRYRKFFNDGSDKNGVNIMCTSILVEYGNGETELIIPTAADLP